MRAGAGFGAVPPWLSLDKGFPVRVGKGSESAAIAADSGGTLWVTFTHNRRVWVAHTTTDDRTWTAPSEPGAGSASISIDDISSIVSFDDD